MGTRKSKSTPGGRRAQRRGIRRWGERNARLYRHWAALLAAFGYRRMAAGCVDSLPGAGRVIDLGCGSGEALRIIARSRPGLRAFACDLSEAFLREARASHPLAHRIACDIEAVPFRTASADAVLCLGVLGHLIEAEQAIREIARIARPGAIVHLWTRTDGLTSRVVRRLFEASNPGARFVLHDPETIRRLLERHGIGPQAQRRVAGGTLWSGRAARGPE